MMTMELMFALQINSEMTMPITVSSVNLKTKIEELKQETAGRWNLPKDSLGKMTCNVSLLSIKVNLNLNELIYLHLKYIKRYFYHRMLRD